MVGSEACGERSELEDEVEMVDAELRMVSLCSSSPASSSDGEQALG